MSYIIESPTPAIFIHIPKTAGNSIISSISQNYNCTIIKNDRTQNDNYHSTIIDANKQLGNIDDYYKFSVVRNPWNRVTSWFLFRKVILEKSIKTLRAGQKIKKLIPNLVNLEKEYTAMNTSLENWLALYNDQPWDFTWFKISDNQSSWLNGYSFDSIIKYENLGEELKEIPFLNISSLPKNNRSQNSNIDWKSLYSTKAKDLVYRLYEEDIDKFKYIF